MPEARRQDGKGKCLILGTQKKVNNNLLYRNWLKLKTMTPNILRSYRFLGHKLFLAECLYLVNTNMCKFSIY